MKYSDVTFELIKNKQGDMLYRRRRSELDGRDLMWISDETRFHLSETTYTNGRITEITVMPHAVQSITYETPP